MAGQFDGKVALVTGGSSGIGRATARLFAQQGAKVVIADIDVEGGQETLAMINAAGGEATFVKTDVSQAAEVEAMVKKTVGTYGRLDYAHNNAGIDGDFVTIVNCSEENWDHVMGVNLKSVWLAMKYEIPQMRKPGGGAIVNTASVAALVAFRTMGAYVASKHGVVGLTKTAALESARLGIRVNAVCPGAIRTPMIDAYIGDDPNREFHMNDLQPIGRMGKPDEVANAVVWLCSDAASFITGAALVIDGGIVAQSGPYPPMPEES
jgi:NAD(P)-dependent dehydrogenase (short-subunit alcohol dehydrogenase family)